MLKGLYTAASGMLSIAMATDSMANNLANVNTVGFKGSDANFKMFSEMFMKRLDGSGKSDIGSIALGSQLHSTFVDFTAGSFRETGNPLDLAIHGDGFFQVRSAADNQLYLTKAGNFTIDQEGFLVTATGDYVQGEDGNIQVAQPGQGGEIVISTNGTVTVGNNTVDRIALKYYENNQALEKVSDALYRETSGSLAIDVPANESSLIQQGELEGSNINAISELVNNIQGMRLYEALQRNIRTHNETLGKAVNEVGQSR
ncbi:MAG: flagellar hook-basal body protein [Cyanobacteria bacterium P01_H01_bin.74]